MTKFLIFNSLFFILAFAPSAHAAIFYFSPPHAEMDINGEAEIFLMLDTEGERVNAVEGKITFSKDKMDLVDINYEDSVINLWIDPVRNCVSNGVEEPGSICFAGITPGGFDGIRAPFQKDVESGKILTLVFKAKNTGSGSVVLENARALLNDGEGTETDISLIPFSVDISGEKSEQTWLIYVIIIIGIIFLFFIKRRLWKKK